VGQARRAKSDKEGWPAARFLAALAEHEIADRSRRRIERHLAEARLPVGKTLQNLKFYCCRIDPSPRVPNRIILLE
jgi:DNA replication protein DnaC